MAMKKLSNPIDTETLFRLVNIKRLQEGEISLTEEEFEALLDELENQGMILRGGFRCARREVDETEPS